MRRQPRRVSGRSLRPARAGTLARPRPRQTSSHRSSKKSRATRRQVRGAGDQGGDVRPDEGRRRGRRRRGQDLHAPVLHHEHVSHRLHGHGVRQLRGERPLRRQGGQPRALGHRGSGGVRPVPPPVLRQGGRVHTSVRPDVEAEHGERQQTVDQGASRQGAGSASRLGGHQAGSARRWICAPRTRIGVRRGEGGGGAGETDRRGVLRGVQRADAG